jgi:YegS/Rv2252/BmrU family lipid kinase
MSSSNEKTSPSDTVAAEDSPQPARKVFLVDNPVSGTTDAYARREAYLQHFENLGWTSEVYETKKDEDLVQVIRDAIGRGFNLVVACGGDGTVAGVASGLVHTDVPMAIIPAGTGNMLARDMNIPLRVDRALEVITGKNRVVHFDAMQVGDKIYILNLGIGLSSEIMANTDRDRKRRFGMLAYLWSGIIQLTGFQRRNFQIEIDGQVSRYRASEVLVVNSSVIGIQQIKPVLTFKPDDGKLDVCILRARSALDLFRLIINLLIRRSRTDPKFRCLQASQKIVIRSDRRLSVQADGEVIGETPLEVTVLAGALQLLAPEVNSTRGTLT